MKAGRRVTESWARRGVAFGLALAVAAGGSMATDQVAVSILLAGLLFLVLECAWTLFAFEASSEYANVQNKDLARMVGQRGLVTKDCSPCGQVRVTGELWQAEVAEGAAARMGEEVVVLSVRGLVLLVARGRVAQ